MALGFLGVSSGSDSTVFKKNHDEGFTTPDPAIPSEVRKYLAYVLG